MEGMGTGSVYTQSCIQMVGSIHKKIDRKLILAKLLFPFYLFLFQPLKASHDPRELSPSPVQAFSTCRSVSIRMVPLTPKWFNILHDWTFNSGLFYTFLPRVHVVHHCMGDSCPGQGTEFFFFPPGKLSFQLRLRLRRALPGKSVQCPPNLKDNKFWGQYCMLQIPRLSKFFKNLYFNSDPSRRVSGAKGLDSTGKIQHNLEQNNTKA